MGSTTMPSHFTIAAILRVGLMTRIAEERDTQAFSRLYDFFAPRIKSYLLGRGAQGALADELLQSALLQVWEKASQYRAASGNVSTWIYRIARNRYFDHLRKQKLRDRPPPEGWYEGPEAVVEDDDDEEQERVEVRKALEQLPSRQAQVLYMSFYQGKTHSEISAELDMPLGSVKSSLRLAFGKLRTSLGERA